MAQSSLPPTVAVVGATATGKSDLALELGERLGGAAQVEIVNADAMQLYRGMNIGTAKLLGPLQRGYVHHELDVLDVTDEASVAAYQRHARSDLASIYRRKRLPIVVGGSGLYLRALLDQMTFPPTDPVVRAELEGELADRGAPALHLRLASRDPVAAQRIGSANGRRIVRALEVIALTGRPYSASLPRYEYELPTVQIGLRLPKDELDRRISARAQAMFDGGLVEEVRALQAQGLREGKTARRATGYAQALAVLDGDLTWAEAIAQTATATRQLARRQIKWFRRDPRIHWLDAQDTGSLPDRARRVLEAAAS